MLLMAVQPNVEAVSSYSFLQAGTSIEQAMTSTAARARRKRIEEEQKWVAKARVASLWSMA